MTNLRINSVVCLLCLVVYTQAVANPESLRPEGDPIKTEVSASLLYSHFAEDFVYHLAERDLPGSLLFDTLGFIVSGQYYINSRFVNPSVPFAFIPRDYRHSSIGLFLGYGTEKRKTDYNSLITSDNVRLTKVAVFGLGGQYHTSRYFFGGSLLFKRETLSGSERLLQLSATGGSLTREWKFGIRSVISKEYHRFHIRDSQRYHVNGFYADQVYVTGQPFLEYTPGSFIRVCASISRTFAITYSDYWEMELPVSLTYTIPDEWWEFGIASTYFNNEHDAKRYTFETATKRYIGDGSIYARGGITHRDLLPIRMNEDATIVHLGLGGDYVCNRIMQLTLQYTYEFGDPIYHGDDRRGHTLAATLRFFD